MGISKKGTYDPAKLYELLENYWDTAKIGRAGVSLKAEIMRLSDENKAETPPSSATLPPSSATLKATLTGNGVTIEEDNICVFDVETTKALYFRPSGVSGIPFGQNEEFYVLVFPPKPKGNSKWGSKNHDYDQGKLDGYTEEQAWMAAYYHAHVDSYGM